MEEKKPTKFDELAKKVYGTDIAEYARGSKPLEESALKICRPAMAALTLPEEYAVLVISERMSANLEVFITNALCKQGDPNKLLFKPFNPLGSFSSRINAAYCFGLVTKQFLAALDHVREIRNAYAHTDDPDEARSSGKYKSHRNKLITLDADHTAECLSKLLNLHGAATEHGEMTKPSEVVAIMLEMCDMLASAAFFAQTEKMKESRAILPACFGLKEMVEVSEEMKPWGKGK